MRVYKPKRRSNSSLRRSDTLAWTSPFAAAANSAAIYEAAAQVYEARRTRYLEARGITVLRFPTDLVFRERENMMTAIALALGVPIR